ncbi:SigB/SigF/SigG family RNA polymerase sigma factor [Kitasatospora sp. NPDC006697]|uniref:SigB/SigF/SigG family RNA polymerase sigma factor n=1 Tax=Kitasatospora sp. NPDC006697 TaxID=3364020 RepID=UPI003696B08D
MGATGNRLTGHATRPVPPPGAEAAAHRALLPELAAVGDPREVAPADARELTRTLFVRLASLEEGTRDYSYVRATLIELNMSLVRYVARRFNTLPESQDDVLQVGAIGLIKAIDRFDPDRGAEFSTFAIPTVAGEIRRHFRDNTWAVHVPRRLQELRLALVKARDELSHRLDRAPTVPELAEHLDLPEAEVIEGLTAANARTAGSLDLSVEPGRSDAPSLADLLLGAVQDRTEQVTDLVALKPLISALPPRSRLILSMRFTEDLTQAQIGARLGLSQMYVSRLLSTTLRTLREGLEGDGGPPARAVRRA